MRRKPQLMTNTVVGFHPDCEVPCAPAEMLGAPLQLKPYPKDQNKPDGIKHEVNTLEIFGGILQKLQKQGALPLTMKHWNKRPAEEESVRVRTFHKPLIHKVSSVLYFRKNIFSSTDTADADNLAIINANVAIMKAICAQAGTKSLIMSIAENLNVVWKKNKPSPDQITKAKVTTFANAILVNSVLSNLSVQYYNTSILITKQEHKMMRGVWDYDEQPSDERPLGKPDRETLYQQRRTETEQRRTDKM
jgi:hypothetical protein